MSKPSVAPDLFNVRQVYQFFGGNIGLQTITKLIKEGSIRAFTLGDTSMLLTTRQECERFRDAMMGSPLKNGTIETYPVLYCLRKTS